MDQIIENAVKYRSEQPVLRFFTKGRKDALILSVEDNGMGIPESDLPRVFEKGFTGKNGRTGKNSTGIGLYLCRRLCGKLGIGLNIFSGKNQTTVELVFQTNDFVAGAQG